MAPSEQERATAWVTPALVMAKTNAVSRQPEENTQNFPLDLNPALDCSTAKPSYLKMFVDKGF